MNAIHNVFHFKLNTIVSTLFNETFQVGIK